MTKLVEVRLPGDLVWEVWKRAEEQGVSAADIIRESLNKPRTVQIVKYVPAKHSTHRARTEETRARIVRLVNAGLDDGAISVEIDRTRRYVADVRRKAGLPPNPRRSRWEVKEIMKGLGDESQ